MGSTPDTTTYTYDTEFIENGKTIDLISIGIVSDTGREYYAVSSDMPIRGIRKHPWLMDNVVPRLPKPAGDWNNHMPRRWLFDYYNPAVKRRKRIAAEVREFLLAEATPELWADYSAYDHVVLAQLWGSMIKLPEGLPMWTHELQQALEKAPPGFVPPEQTEGVHNALEDARHNMRVLEALRAAKES
ncbi:3'-5' exoribonuclease domain-containing protein [Nocardia wallacei]|uniref:3'-5' exoribonuclease domain-containing protein n=1 Tax=Nocardia wallacei TaxID=480035 RepID=UPI00245412B0|nr:3'-5' exoribonuclease [Nocardia wallacei]